MGIACLVIGESGSGKSTSLRNFKNGEIAIINVVGKPLPFRNNLGVFSTDDYTRVVGAMQKTKMKSIVIDDCQYLMANEYMRRAKENGFQKFTDIGQNFWALIREVEKLPPDVVVYFMGHIDTDTNGKEKFKTIGKMLDEKITVEGLFTIVLKCEKCDGVHYFKTTTNGADTVKTPIGMFGSEQVDNDLKLVDDAIRDYYFSENGKEENK